MEPESKGSFGLIFGLAFFAGSAVVAYMMLVMGEPAMPESTAPVLSAPSAPKRPQSSPFGEAAQAENIEAQVYAERYGSGAPTPSSSLGMVRKPSEPARGPDPLAADVRGKVPDRGAPKPDAVRDMLEAGLTKQEMQKLVDSAGQWDEKAAERAGATRGMLFEMGKAILRYPRIVSFVLNNEAVVEGFMRQPRVAKNCSEPAALAGYLSDGKSATGIKLGMKTFEESLRHEGSTQAIMGSELVHRVLKCPSIPAVTGNPATVGGIAMANPPLLQLYMNPKITKSLGNSPAAAAADALGRR